MVTPRRQNDANLKICYRNSSVLSIHKILRTLMRLLMIERRREEFPRMNRSSYALISIVKRRWMQQMSGSTSNFTLKPEVNPAGSTSKKNLQKIRHNFS